MALPPKPRLVETLQYFDQFDYPLTAEELSKWQGKTKNPSGDYANDGHFFFLPGRMRIVKTRLERHKISLVKWELANKLGKKLNHLPFIKAVLVTGSLAMNNAQNHDDIDLMIITAADTLWITRAIVNMLFTLHRRWPGQAQAPDKLCFNLWLDEKNLHIIPHDLYRAHEVLQAKLLWDKFDTHLHFLQANSWVKDFLPHAYPKILSQKPNNPKSGNLILRTINGILFVVQYLYMRPKITTERVGLGFAFFHPIKTHPLTEN